MTPDQLDDMARYLCNAQGGKWDAKHHKRAVWRRKAVLWIEEMAGSVWQFREDLDQGFRDVERDVMSRIDDGFTPWSPWEKMLKPKDAPAPALPRKWWHVFAKVVNIMRWAP